MAMTNIKLDHYFLMFAVTQKLFVWFYINLVVMKFFIIFPQPHRQLFSLSKLVGVLCDPSLSYAIC